MYKKDGTPDLRYSANRRGTSGTISSFEVDCLNSFFKDKNKKAYLLRDFRSKLLEVDPNVIKTLFKLIEDTSWYQTTYTFNWPDLEWLAKETPEVTRITSSGDIGFGYKDSFEQEIEKIDDLDYISSYRDVESLLKSYLDNSLKAGYLTDEKLFQDNINIIEGIVSNALNVEKIIILREKEFEKLQKEKEDERFKKWTDDYGYCTRNSEYESALFDIYLPLNRKELLKAKNETIERGEMMDMYKGIEWLNGIDYNSRQIVRLKYLTEEEILHVKKNFILMEDPNICDLELQRRSELKLWRKFYEIVFVRITFQPINLLKLIFFSLFDLLKYIIKKGFNWIKQNITKMKKHNT